MRNTPVWDTGEWSPSALPTRSIETDVCVIGLGGSGLSCIATLLQHGQRVVGIDAGLIAGAAAGRNGGFLLAGVAAFYHQAVSTLGRDRARMLYLATIDEIQRFAIQTPAAVRLTGSLRIAESALEMRDCAAQYDAMCADELPVEWYDGPEGCGLLVPTDGVCNPLSRHRAYAHAVRSGGAMLYEGVRALQIEQGRVRTDCGEIRCNTVVVAVDGQLEQVLPELGVRVRSVRLQMLATAPLDAIRFPRPVYLRWGYEYWQQLPDGRIALGGFRDRGGAQEWGAPAEPGGAVQAELEQFLRTQLQVDASITHRWAASVGYTAEGMPIFEEVRPGVWAIGGYCGTGNIIGALCGRAVAHRVTHGVCDSLGELFCPPTTQ